MRRLIAVTTVVLCAACTSARSGADPTTSPTASTSAAPTPTGTPLAPRPTVPSLTVHSKKNGSQYPTFIFQKGNRKIYAVRADSSDTERPAEGAGHSVFKRPHIQFFDREGKTLVADAPIARASERDQSIVMSERVHARSQDGRTLECDTLTYNDKTERLHGEGDVVLAMPDGSRATSGEIDVDLRLSNWHLGAKP